MKNKFYNTFMLIIVLCALLGACEKSQSNSESKQNNIENTKEVIENETNSENDITDKIKLINDIQEKTEFALNTVVTIKLYEAPKFSDEDWIITFKILKDIESLMSCHIESSEVMAINNKAGVEPVKVSEDTYRVIKFAKKTAEETQGAFDPTIGVLTKLWNIGGEKERVPNQDEIDEALLKVDYKKIILNEEDKSVFLKDEGMFIDLGGIAKGYSADKISKYLYSRGVKRGILDFGGNISLIGAKDESSAWRVGVRKPKRNEFSVYASLYAEDESVVSSGDYERYFEQDGVVYHHIISPFTGYPTNNEIRGSSVILRSSMQADAYATALIVMGKQKAIKFITDKPLEAVIVYKDLSSYNLFNSKRDFKIE